MGGRHSCGTRYVHDAHVEPAGPRHPRAATPVRCLRAPDNTGRDAFELIGLFRSLGTRALTITGGGEPPEYPYLEGVIDRFVQNNIQVGLVTNGIHLDRLSRDTLRRLTWCRISHSDERTFTEEYAQSLEAIVCVAPRVDWAFSYVVTAEPNEEMIRKVVHFADVHGFTHVRLVADLLDYANVDLERMKKKINLRGTNDSKVIYQGRNKPRVGGPCFICFLKPVVAADCKVYTCCGAQYALDPPSRRMPEELCLGSAFDLDKIAERSYYPFPGDICKRCYYSEYNRLLADLFSRVEHVNFV